MSRKDTIHSKLSVLNPHFLEVIDESHLHEGHSGNISSNGQSHYAIKISANGLNGLSLIKQHKIINNLLKEEFNNGLHALSIKINK